MATGVLKVRIGGVWQNIGASGSLPAHAIYHMAGGADAILLDRLAPPTDVTTLNATTGAHGLLPKLSGDAAQFLNGQGAWVTVPPSIAGPEASIIDDLAVYGDITGKVLKDSGLALSKVARLDQGPTFAGVVTCTGMTAALAGGATLTLKHTDAAVDRKIFQMYYQSGTLVLRAVSDNLATQLGYATLDYNGNFNTSSLGQIFAAGAVKIGTPDGAWPSVMFYGQYLTFNSSTTGQLGWFHQTGIFNLNQGYLRFGSTLFTLQNTGASSVLTVRNDGVVTIPYYLVIPVGTDKWAPA